MEPPPSFNSESRAKLGEAYKMEPIVIDNPDILRFFENTMFEPQKFILKLISIYKLQRAEEEQFKNLGRTLFHFEDIDPILREIQACESQKEVMLKIAHDIIITTNRMKFPEAEELYKKIYGKVKVQNVFVCDICKNASFTKTRALETHKRTCIHKSREKQESEEKQLLDNATSAASAESEKLRLGELGAILPPPAPPIKVEKKAKQLTHHINPRLYQSKTINSPT